MTIDQKIIIITGGTTGIGKETAISLKENEYFVIANYHNNETSAQIFQTETQIAIKKWDITNYDACKVAIEEIIQEYGQIHGLINNAGIINDKMFHKMQLQEWQEVLNTNLFGAFNMCHNVINHMREKNFGRIINVSSVNALIGQIGQCNYAASKAGLIGFTKSLARESTSKNITVNCIAPGYVETSMTQNIPENIKQEIIDQIPLKRFAKPSEIANGILFLLENSYITGTTLSINGGLHMN